MLASQGGFSAGHGGSSGEGSDLDRQFSMILGWEDSGRIFVLGEAGQESNGQGGWKRARKGEKRQIYCIYMYS